MFMSCGLQEFALAFNPPFCASGLQIHVLLPAPTSFDEFDFTEFPQSLEWNVHIPLGDVERLGLIDQFN
jgi:hypothetical protein